MSLLGVVANTSFAICAGEASRDQGVNLLILKDTSHIQEINHSHIFTHQQPKKKKNHPWFGCFLFLFFFNFRGTVSSYLMDLFCCHNSYKGALGEET